MHCYVSLCTATSPYALLRLPMHCYVSPCTATSPHALLRLPMHCYVSLCTATSPYALLRLPMHCYVSLFILRNQCIYPYPKLGLWRIKFINSSRVLASSANTPRIALVTVQEPGFCTPRITIHI